MTCAKISRQLPGYVDGALSSRTRTRVREHLEVCAHCREQLERYGRLSHVFSSLRPCQPPADLVVRIRVAVAQARQAQGFAGWIAICRTRMWLLLENVLKPLALPATGGFVTAMVVFAIILQLIQPGIPLGAVSNDVPTGLLRPAALISLSELPDGVSANVSFSGVEAAEELLVEVTVDADGRMVDYEILSGPTNEQVHRELDQMLMFSRFRPMMSFGRPTSGGHVMLSFSRVRVRG